MLDLVDVIYIGCMSTVSGIGILANIALIAAIRAR